MTLSGELQTRNDAPPATQAGPGRDDRATQLPLPRLYAMRLGYLVMAVGLALTKWPLLISHSTPWPLMEGVVTCMLVALSLVALLGLRHPVAMLPVLLFEVAWKVIWVAVVVLPLWAADQLDAATTEVFVSCLVVLLVVAVIPWRFAFAQFGTKQGDPWRAAGAHPAVGRRR
jgi:hypothetical protein